MFGKIIKHTAVLECVSLAIAQSAAICSELLVVKLKNNQEKKNKKQGLELENLDVSFRIRLQNRILYKKSVAVLLYEDSKEASICPTFYNVPKKELSYHWKTIC